MISKKLLTRGDVVGLMQLDSETVQQLVLIAYGSAAIRQFKYDVWLGEEYTEKDNLVFRLYIALKPHLKNTSDVFTVLYHMRTTINALVILICEQATAGVGTAVIVVGDQRYVKWPGNEDWLDLWDPQNPKSGRYVESSLRITTAVHLHQVLQPLS